MSWRTNPWGLCPVPSELRVAIYGHYVEHGGEETAAWIGISVGTLERIMLGRRVQPETRSKVWHKVNDRFLGVPDAVREVYRLAEVGK